MSHPSISYCCTRSLKWPVFYSNVQFPPVTKRRQPHDLGVKANLATEEQQQKGWKNRSLPPACNRGASGTWVERSLRIAPVRAWRELIWKNFPPSSMFQAQYYPWFAEWLWPTPVFLVSLCRWTKALVWSTNACKCYDRMIYKVFLSASWGRKRKERKERRAGTQAGAGEMSQGRGNAFHQLLHIIYSVHS